MRFLSLQGREKWIRFLQPPARLNQGTQLGGWDSAGGLRKEVLIPPPYLSGVFNSSPLERERVSGGRLQGSNGDILRNPTGVREIPNTEEATTIGKDPVNSFSSCANTALLPHLGVTWPRYMTISRRRRACFSLLLLLLLISQAAVSSSYLGTHSVQSYVGFRN